MRTKEVQDMKEQKSDKTTVGTSAKASTSHLIERLEVRTAKLMGEGLLTAVVSLDCPKPRDNEAFENQCYTFTEHQEFYKCKYRSTLITNENGKVAVMCSF